MNFKKSNKILFMKLNKLYIKEKVFNLNTQIKQRLIRTEEQEIVNQK